MVNWYYVVGSDRVGPVSVDALKVLFLNKEITLETYVWKKGFQNWERLKDVSELKLDDISIVEKVTEKKPETIKEESSPEIFFSFDWGNVKEQEDLFFLKIGKDRHNVSQADIYGPYSLIELKEALTEKRINLETLIFTPGMNSWTKIQDTIINEKFKGTQFGSVSLNEVPLIMVFEHLPLPLVALVKKAGTKDGILLGTKPFIDFQNKTLRASLYMGNEMKVKNVQVQIQAYDKKNQSITCHFVELNSDAKKIMLNHAV